MLYLTSRCIGQSTQTRSYLEKLYQENGVALPAGPVLLSPDRMLASLVRELHHRPDQLKIMLLHGVINIFPSGSNPIYAGFGNRITDIRSYTQSGVPSERCYTVDSHGIVKIIGRECLTSYTEMAQHVSEYFSAETVER